MFYLRVADGTRTRDSQDHNLVLYQLNYSHHRRLRGVVDLSRWNPLEPNRLFRRRYRRSARVSAAMAAISLVDGPGGVTNAVWR